MTPRQFTKQASSVKYLFVSASPIGGNGNREAAVGTGNPTVARHVSPIKFRASFEGSAGSEVQEIVKRTVASAAGDELELVDHTKITNCCVCISTDVLFQLCRSQTSLGTSCQALAREELAKQMRPTNRGVPSGIRR